MTAIAPTIDLFGVGLFTVSDAARLTRIPPSRVRRWVKGYSYKRKGKNYTQVPIINTDMELIDGEVTISYLDLIEIRFVDRFYQAGVHPVKLRKAVVNLSDILKLRHPFSGVKLKTDGASVFMSLNQDDRDHLLDVVTLNYAIKNVIEPLTDEMHYGLDGITDWWMPNKNTRNIIVNPKVAFGRPTVQGTRLESSLLSDAYQAEGSYESVSYWYNVPVDQVRQAVQFEGELAA